MELAEVAKDHGYEASAIAQHLHVSERHLRRHIRATMGCALGVWLDERRLTDAIPLLRSNRTLKEVASDLGFKQQSHFTRKFKNRYGIAPSEFNSLYAKVWGRYTGIPRNRKTGA